MEIVEQLLPDLSDADVRDLISGTLDPAEEKVKSRARDREFEWYVAAICKRARLTPSLVEPDVICTTDRGNRALAAKRLSSRAGVRANIKKAREQIDNCGTPGFAVLDVTRVLEPHYDYMLHWKIGDAAIQRALSAFLHSERNNALNLSADRSMKAVLIRMVFPLISPGLRLGTYESWSVAAAAPNAAGDANSFLKAFLSGLEGV